VTSRDLTRAWEAKGFVRTSRVDHCGYLLEGTSVKSFVSNGPVEDLGDELLSRIALQMHLTLPQLREFVRCDLSEAQYRAILVTKSRQNLAETPPHSPKGKKQKVSSRPNKRKQK